MIFYFTGTGNSGYVATEIAKANSDDIFSISKLMNNNDQLEFTLKDNEIIAFVYPIYAWAPPKMVIDFIKKAKFNNYKNNYITSIATCAGNIGNAKNLLKNTLSNKGLTLNSGFSILMPNNYIIMGNVDSKEIENKKLENTKKEINEINTIIKNREKNIFKVVKGFAPTILTSIINPIFNKHAINTSKFYVTEKCIGCGICADVCNCKTINLVDKKPKWSNSCSQCLACIHYCPTKAIQYGKSTLEKGRYTNPYFKQ